jgi:hypothetical protein
MENDSQDSVKVKYFFGDSFFDTEGTDSLIYLKSHQKDTLFIFEQISPRVYDKENGDIIRYIINVDIIRLSDSAKLKKDVTLRNNWKFVVTGDHSALMEFRFDNSDF